MDVMQAIKDRRSIRKFLADPVPEEALNTVLEAIRLAPSWANTQCWRLVIVRDAETRSKLAETLKSTKPGGKNPATEAVRNAPIVIVACAAKELSGYYKDEDGRSVPVTDKGEWWFMFDLGVALEHAALAAHALGLGTVHVGLFDTAEVVKILSVPEDNVVVELLPLGWPDQEPPARPRKEINEVAFSEKYPG